MRYIRELPNEKELLSQYSLSPEQKHNRLIRIQEICHILAGSDNRKILCIGPCSADNEDAVLQYTYNLAALQEKVKHRFLIIPRVYTGKPRTNGLGYKGMLHRPDSSDGNDNIFNGILATRKIHFNVIRETGLFCADEMLYPEATYYITDLLGYIAVGARSVENQQHRLVASGLDMPVGMKNPTSGDIEIMLNAIVAAQHSQKLLYHGWECETDGNLFAHAILRGYSSADGKMYSNYHFESICDLYDSYVKRGLRNSSVIVDCNHSNSRKHYDEQIRISREVFDLCDKYKDVDGFVKGVMIESYLEDGCQIIGEGIFGKSITDPCLGWKKTEKLILSLSEGIY